MPSIIVLGIPADVAEEQLQKLHQDIAISVAAIEELGLQDNDIMPFFPGDRRTTFLGKQISIIAVRFHFRERRHERLLANLLRAIGILWFPNAHVEVGIVPSRTADTNLTALTASTGIPAPAKRTATQIPKEIGDLTPTQYFSNERFAGAGLSPLRIRGRITRACSDRRIDSIDDLVSFGMAEFSTLDNIGKTTCTAIAKILAQDHIIW